jgi:ankyrin repeat protein
MHAVHDNDSDQLKKLGARECNLNFLYDYKELSFDRRISPLILASYLGRIECVKMILENPFIDVDQSSEDSGYTPLCVACLTGNYEIVKLLVDAAAETNLPNKFNQTPFVLCFSRLNEETNVFENTKICFKMIELLLDHGGDINWIVDKNKGHTILMQFCGVKMELEDREKRINLEVIRFLVQHGADKSIQSNKGKTSYDLTAKHCNQTEVLEVLKNTSQICFHGKNKPKSTSISIDKIKAQQALDSGKKKTSSTE